MKSANHSSIQSSGETARLKLLHLEDDPLDRELVREALSSGGMDVEIDYAQSKGDFLDAIHTKHYDLILSDFSLPSFTGMEALETAHELVPQTPYIFLSGTIGEERAVESLRKGATDYLLKDRMTRLVPAIKRALSETREYQQKMATEQALREQAALLDKASDAIMVLDLDGRITYWNQGAHLIYGWTQQEVIGKLISDLLFVSRGEFDRALESVMQRGELSSEITHTGKNAKSIIVHSRWTLVNTDSGQPKSILCIHSDITEKKKLHEQFLRVQRLESIGTLASGIAHDINNVLAPILMSVDLLRMDPKTACRSDLLNTIQSCARRGSDMVQQVLSFGRGEEGKHVQLQIRNILRDIKKMADQTFGREIEVRTDFSSELRPVLGNATQLHQVFLNLCVNARDAMPRGGTITFRAENVDIDENYVLMNGEGRPGPHICVHVLDTGSGMPREVMEKMFDPFFTTKEPGKGTGLGLSTVLTIVKRHGGFMRVDSRLNEGTQFHVFLPADSHRTTGGETSPNSALPNGNDECILVVEDEHPVRTLMKQILELHGYRVIEVENGTEAVACFAENKDRIDLILTDLNMPVLDGFQAIRVIKKINRHAEVIAMSGVLDQNRQDRLQTLDVRVVLQKPFTTAELLKAIHSVLNRREP